jgi:hypothetical protein
MGKLVAGNEGVQAEEVGLWVEEKHFFITEYIKLSHGARLGFIGPNDAGATYIDLFCGPGLEDKGQQGICGRRGCSSLEDGQGMRVALEIEITYVAPWGDRRTIRPSLAHDPRSSTFSA